MRCFTLPPVEPELDLDVEWLYWRSFGLGFIALAVLACRHRIFRCETNGKMLLVRSHVLSVTKIKFCYGQWYFTFSLLLQSRKLRSLSNQLSSLLTCRKKMEVYMSHVQGKKHAAAAIVTVDFEMSMV